MPLIETARLFSTCLCQGLACWLDGAGAPLVGGACWGPTMRGDLRLGTPLVGAHDMLMECVVWSCSLVLQIEKLRPNGRRRAMVRLVVLPGLLAAMAAAL